jgi:hypothetical protein
LLLYAIMVIESKHSRCPPKKSQQQNYSQIPLI